jgi:hypothetical protein
MNARQLPPLIAGLAITSAALLGTAGTAAAKGNLCHDAAPGSPATGNVDAPTPALTGQQLPVPADRPGFRLPCS